MAVEIRVDISRAVSALTGIQQRVEELVKDALDESAAMVQNSAREGHPKVSDRIRGAEATTFRDVTPSGAGTFSGMYRFLTRTGVLRNSIKIEGAKKVAGGYTSAVISGVEYSDRVEYSGYPFMRPALELNRKNIIRRIALAVQGGVEGK